MASDYFAHEHRQRVEAQRAWRDFEGKLSRRDRQLLRSLPTGDARSGFNGEADVTNSVRASWVPDMAASVDSLEDVLREEFGLSEDQAGRLARWHTERVWREAEAAKAVQLSRIIGVLIRPMHDVRAVITGLALAAGIIGQTALNDVSSGADAGRQLGKHRATLSYWKRSWQKLLELKNETFGKSDDAKARYSEERNRVVTEQRNGTWRPKKG